MVFLFPPGIKARRKKLHWGSGFWALGSAATGVEWGPRLCSRAPYGDRTEGAEPEALAHARSRQGHAAKLAGTSVRLEIVVVAQGPTWRGRIYPWIGSSLRVFRPARAALR